MILFKKVIEDFQFKKTSQNVIRNKNKNIENLP